MERYMKRLTATAAVVLAVAFGAVAQESAAAEKNVVKTHALTALESDLHRSNSPEIVESAIYTVVELKHSFPDLDYSKLQSTLNQIAQESGNLSVGYKAELANMYLSHSSDIQVTPIAGAQNHDYLFKQIADQLEQAFLMQHGAQNTKMQ